MVDVEDQIYTKIRAALKSQYPSINVQSVLTYTPSVFPTVCIEEADNASYARTRDTESNDNHAEVMYEINVYSNLASGAKSQCKSIFSVIDGVMDDLGFTRTAKTPINEELPTRYRLVGRYSAVIDNNEVIYRR